MPDFSAQVFLDGIAWGAGFSIPVFVGITWSVLKILSHPTIRHIAKAAANMTSGEGGGMLTKGARLIENLLGGGK